MFFYRIFFDKLNRAFLAHDATQLQVLEIGSGIGIGSANNANTLMRKFKKILYIATDKREALANMTRKELSSVFRHTGSASIVYVHDWRA